MFDPNFKKICFKKVDFWDFRGPLELLANPKMAQILDSEPLLTLQKIETWAETKLDTCPVPTVHSSLFTWNTRWEHLQIRFSLN